MKTFFLGLAILLCLILSACSGSPNRESVKIDDRAVKTIDNDMPASPHVAQSAEPGGLSASERKFGEERVLSDNSRIITSYDGSGLKTETRIFPDGSQVKFVRVQTSSDGSVEATVYTQNGGAKSLSGGSAHGVLTASANEINKSISVYSETLSTPAPSNPIPAPTAQAVVQSTPANPSAVQVSDVSSVQLPPVSKPKPASE